MKSIEYMKMVQKKIGKKKKKKKAKKSKKQTVTKCPT